MSTSASSPASVILTVTEAAALLGVTAPRLFQAIRAGELAVAGRVGNGVQQRPMLRRSDVEAYRRKMANRDNNGAKLPRGYLAPVEVAARLGVTPARVRQLIEARALRARRFGRRLGIKPGDLDTYREGQRAGAPA